MCELEGTFRWPGDEEVARDLLSRLLSLAGEESRVGSPECEIDGRLDRERGAGPWMLGLLQETSRQNSSRFGYRVARPAYPLCLVTAYSFKCERPGSNALTQPPEV